MQSMLLRGFMLFLLAMLGACSEHPLAESQEHTYAPRTPIGNATASAESPSPCYIQNEKGEKEAVPIRLAAPLYPPEALKKRFGGYVKLAGYIDERGYIRDPRVIVSKPEGVFDSAALEAFRKLQYCLLGKNPKLNREVERDYTFRLAQI